MKRERNERMELAREFAPRLGMAPKVVHAWMAHVAVEKLTDIRDRYLEVYRAGGKDAETCAMADDVWAFWLGPDDPLGPPRPYPKNSPCPTPSVELTEIGEQYVIPGCEKHIRPAGSQLKLWEESK